MVSYEETGDAIKIVGAKSTPEGIRAEYDYIAQQLGEKDRDWRMVRQSLLDKDGVEHDALEIELANGERRTFLFDVSGFFGIEVEQGLIQMPSEAKRSGCLGGVLGALLRG